MVHSTATTHVTPKLVSNAITWATFALTANGMFAPFAKSTAQGIRNIVALLITELLVPHPRLRHPCPLDLALFLLLVLITCVEETLTHPAVPIAPLLRGLLPLSKTLTTMT